MNTAECISFCWNFNVRSCSRPNALLTGIAYLALLFGINECLISYLIDAVTDWRIDVHLISRKVNTVPLSTVPHLTGPLTANGTDAATNTATNMLQKRYSPRDIWSRDYHWFLVVISNAICLFIGCFGCTRNIAVNLRNGDLNLPGYDFVTYNQSTLTFEISFSFSWPDNDTCFILLKDEKFEGNGHSINLTAFTNWEGLIGITPTGQDGGPSSLEDAPLIRNIHTIGGETSVAGGFIIRANQMHFIVNSCSSSGIIKGEAAWYGGGGICGQKCSGDILISHCWSTGEIKGPNGGGITGLFLGEKHGRVNITHCHSTGDIVGLSAGGITGRNPGSEYGQISITHSYSTGTITGSQSGGICGLATGSPGGVIRIEQCYSLGEITGNFAGGIAGRSTGSTDAYVSIQNCYSRGNIKGSNNTGGICGYNTGDKGGTVILSNVYASGIVVHKDSGGLIGMVSDFAKEVNITMSVHNGDVGGTPIVGNFPFDESILSQEKNSDTLDDIIGRVYCYAKADHWGALECWDDETIWLAVQNDFPRLLNVPMSTPEPTGLPTCSSSSSPSTTQTQSFTSTPSSSRTLTPSETVTSSNSVSPSSSPTSLGTPSSSSTPASTGRPRRIRPTPLSVQRPRRYVV